jgi:hypothetical protein
LTHPLLKHNRSTNMTQDHNMTAKTNRQGLQTGIILCVALCQGMLTAAEAQPAPMHHQAEPSNCAGTGLKCATAVTPAFDAHNDLWLAWVAGGAVSVARSTDLGRTVKSAVTIGSYGTLMDSGADAKPQLAIDGKGHAVVAYGVFKDKAYNAEVYVSTSESIWAKDGPAFTAARSLSADPASQRFPTLSFNSHGRLFAAWLDKRIVAKSRELGQAQSGAALAYAWSDDAGRSFTPDAMAAGDTCECCRIALAFDRSGQPLLLYRSIFTGGERDHAILGFSGAGRVLPAYRVSQDHWVIDGCPHHGPSVSMTADGTLHAAWFTEGTARQGLFYARSSDHGRRFSEPKAVGNPAQRPGRPSLLSTGDTIRLAWKEFDGKRILIKEQHSADAGQHWSPERIIAETSHAADHPVLIARGRDAYLSWMTHDEGYQLMKLQAP